MCDTFQMTTRASPERTRLTHSLVLLLPAVLFGLLVSVQWRTQADRNELTVRYNTPLLDAAKTLQNEQNTLKAQLADLRADIALLQELRESRGKQLRDSAWFADARTSFDVPDRRKGWPGAKHDLGCAIAWTTLPSFTLQRAMKVALMATAAATIVLSLDSRAFSTASVT